MLLLIGRLALVVAALMFILLSTAGDPAIAQNDTQAEKPALATGLSVETERGSLTASVDWNDMEGAAWPPSDRDPTASPRAPSR